MWWKEGGGGGVVANLYNHLERNILIFTLITSLSSFEILKENVCGLALDLPTISYQLNLTSLICDLDLGAKSIKK